jgi:malonate-semialdehyde dehydrogenase (acetylating)/methylmalonate-semialdehyde dehydrogenase
MPGGCEKPRVDLPDADLEMCARIVSDSAFGCAGQRCLAISVAVTVGEAHKSFTDEIAKRAGEISVGNGLDANVRIGPVITRESKVRIENLIAREAEEGAQVLLDGRIRDGASPQSGNFLGPTLLDHAPAVRALSNTEIFGPVLSLLRAKNPDEGIEIISRSAYGNMASIFTSNSTAARKFRYEVPAGNIGINIGVAAPMAYFTFSGWRDSFFGVLHGQGRDVIEFYTDKKVVVERSPKEWSRAF